MNESQVKPHWSFWIVCLVALIWNVMGSINFIMQLNPEMLANYPEAAKSVITSRPIWATVTFAMAVFGGTFGVVLLLLKNSMAGYLFIASLVGVITTSIHTFQISAATEILVGSLMSLVVAVFLVWYAKLVKLKNWTN